MERTMSQKLIAEFVGAFTLIFIGAGAIIAFTSNPSSNGGIVQIAIAHGLAIGVMVSALGHVSGGHFNPAVTIGMLATAKIRLKDAAGYIVAQLAGGVAAAGLLRWALPQTAWKGAALGTPSVNYPLGVSNGQAVLIEAVLTFFLVWVVFASAVDPEGSFGKIAGLAIGFTIMMDILMGGSFTGAAMNPARAFGPALVGGYWTGWYVYWIGPIAGGVIAAALYDGLILAKRGAGGSAEPGEAPHAWGAHGEDADAVRDAEE